jgi:hypothetical protein
MFDAVGNSVVKLRRTAIGHVKDDRIPVGAYRELDEKEVKEFFNPSNKPAKKTESNLPTNVQKRKPNPRNPSANTPKQSSHGTNNKTSRFKKSN